MNASAGFLPMRIAPDALPSASTHSLKPEPPTEGTIEIKLGMNGLALQVQEGLGRDPHAGDLYVFRGRRGDLIKVLWHDGLGMSLYAKRLERGRFLWPSPADGVVPVTAAQLGYLLEGKDWRHPQRTYRPEAAG